MRLFARQLNLCTALFLLTTILRAAEPATNKTESLQDLSARFVRALAQGDVAACQACWMSFDQMRTVVTNPPPGVDMTQESRPNNLAYMEKSWAERDRQIQERIRNLVAGLERHVDLKTMTLTRVSPRDPQTRQGVSRVEQIEIEMTVGDQTLAYTLGGAVRIGTQWYLVELPGSGATLITDGRTETIRCEALPVKP